jgi:hypothetical protein
MKPAKNVVFYLQWKNEHSRNRPKKLFKKIDSRMKKREEDTPDPYLATLIWCRWERNTTGRRAQTPEKRACNEQEAGGRRGHLGGGRSNDCARRPRSLPRLVSTGDQRGLYGNFTNGGLAFLQNIHPENILSLSLSLSLDPRRTWFWRSRWRSVSFGTNVSFHSSPLPVLGSVFSFILANISRPKWLRSKNHG